MTEKWTPFDEGVYHPTRYEFFFERDLLAELEHPQDTEDFLHEVCPENYCYAWVWKSRFSRTTGITNLLIGMPEDAAILIRLRTGLEPFDMNTVEIGHPNNGKHTIHQKIN